MEKREDGEDAEDAEDAATASRGATGCLTASRLSLGIPLAHAIIAMRIITVNDE